MRPSLLATRPYGFDVPGDIYAFGELPPQPQVMLPDGSLANVNRDQITRDMKIIPGCLGIMHHHGECMGFSKDRAVWRFGFVATSKLARAFDCSITTGDNEHGFAWVIATRRTGVVIETWRGWANNLPDKFKRVIDAPALIRCAEGHMQSAEFFAPTTNAIRSNRPDSTIGTRPYGPTFRD